MKSPFYIRDTLLLHSQDSSCLSLLCQHSYCTNNTGQVYGKSILFYWVLEFFGVLKSTDCILSDTLKLHCIMCILALVFLNFSLYFVDFCLARWPGLQ